MTVSPYKLVDWNSSEPSLRSRKWTRHLRSRPRSGWMAARLERIRGDLRTILSAIWGCSRFRSGVVPFAVAELHHRCLLVHCIHVLRQSGGDHCEVVVRYVCGNSTSRRSTIHRGATSWSFGCYISVRLACPKSANTCAGSAGPSSRTGRQMKWRERRDSNPRPPA